MAKVCIPAWPCKAVSLSLIVALFVSTSMIALAAPGKALSGEIIVSGTDSITGSSVMLNGEPVVSGRTFFTSAVISTPENRSATVNLGKLGRVSLSPSSTLSISLAENAVNGELSAGQMQVYGKDGVAVNIKTPDNRVISRAGQATNFGVDLRSGSTVATGEVELERGASAKAADMSDKEKMWWLIGIAAAATIIIILVVTDDDEVESPVR